MEVFVSGAIAFSFLLMSFSNYVLGDKIAFWGTFMCCQLWTISLLIIKASG